MRRRAKRKPKGGRGKKRAIAAENLEGSDNSTSEYDSNDGDFEEVEESDEEFDEEEASNYSDNSDHGSDAEEEPIFSTSLAAARDHYRSLEMHEREHYDQELMNVQLLLKYSLDKAYSVEDLDDRTIMERGLRLLARARFGIEKEDLRVCPHIEYRHLNEKTLKAQKRLVQKSVQQLMKKAVEAGLCEPGEKS